MDCALQHLKDQRDVASDDTCRAFTAIDPETSVKDSQRGRRCWAAADKTTIEGFPLPMGSSRGGPACERERAND